MKNYPIKEILENILTGQSKYNKQRRKLKDQGTQKICVHALYRSGK